MCVCVCYLSVTNDCIQAAGFNNEVDLGMDTKN